MFKIEIYTMPNCIGCNMMKREIKGSKYEENVELKSIHGKEGKDNLDFVKNRGYKSLPVVIVKNGDREEVSMGFTPIRKLTEMIVKIEN